MIYIAPLIDLDEDFVQSLEAVGWQETPCEVCGVDVLVPPSVWRVGGPDLICEPCWRVMREIERQART